MNAPARLGLYAAGLVVVFGGAYALAGALVPESVVDDWMRQSGTHQEQTVHDPAPGQHPPGGSDDTDH